MKREQRWRQTSISKPRAVSGSGIDGGSWKKSSIRRRHGSITAVTVGGSSGPSLSSGGGITATAVSPPDASSPAVSGNGDDLIAVADGPIVSGGVSIYVETTIE
mmetsp:Transcript_3519/g.7683  ORF Transcript_3519/g.7683 Transcript_3519/m.7683 type:complete len:104 (-) Transcript_3519:569-880(-)